MLLLHESCYYRVLLLETQPGNSLGVGGGGGVPKGVGGGGVLSGKGAVVVITS